MKIKMTGKSCGEEYLYDNVVLVIPSPRGLEITDNDGEVRHFSYRYFKMRIVNDDEQGE
ncbi:hypothetical protein [Treponema sp. R6D11]